MLRKVIPLFLPGLYDLYKMTSNYCSKCDRETLTPYHYNMDLFCRRCYFEEKFKGMTPMEYIESKHLHFKRSAVDNHVIIKRNHDLILFLTLGEYAWWDDANYPDFIHIEKVGGEE